MWISWPCCHHNVLRHSETFRHCLFQNTFFHTVKLHFILHFFIKNFYNSLYFHNYRNITLIKEGNSVPPPDPILKFLVESSTGETVTCANCDQVWLFFCLVFFLCLFRSYANFSIFLVIYQLSTPSHFPV